VPGEACSRFITLGLFRFVFFAVLLSTSMSYTVCPSLFLGFTQNLSSQPFLFVLFVLKSMYLRQQSVVNQWSDTSRAVWRKCTQSVRLSPADSHHVHFWPSVLSLFSYYVHVHFCIPLSSVPAVVHVNFYTTCTSVPAVAHVNFYTPFSPVPAVLTCYSPYRNLQFICSVCCFVFHVFLMNHFSLYFDYSYFSIATFSNR